MEWMVFLKSSKERGVQAELLCEQKQPKSTTLQPQVRLVTRTQWGWKIKPAQHPPTSPDPYL